MPVTSVPELKTARLTVLIDPALKEAFEALCYSHDLTPSQVVRRLLREYMAEHSASAPATYPAPLEAAPGLNVSRKRG